KGKREKHGIHFVTSGNIPSPVDSLATSALVAPTPSSFPTPPFDIEYWRKQFPIFKTHFHVAKNMLPKVFRSPPFWIPLLASS
ncbi:MAG: hypothetical protein KAV87_38290, partial [Desulfobacteraceae bacterium]|nr:hypothetical protein [Desulfobacteraceae bacterium]